MRPNKLCNSSTAGIIFSLRNLQTAALSNALALRRYLSVIHTRFFIALFVAMMILNLFYDR